MEIHHFLLESPWSLHKPETKPFSLLPPDALFFLPVSRAQIGNDEVELKNKTKQHSTYLFILNGFGVKRLGSAL